MVGFPIPGYEDRTYRCEDSWWNLGIALHPAQDTPAHGLATPCEHMYNRWAVPGREPSADFDNPNIDINWMKFHRIITGLAWECDPEWKKYEELINLGCGCRNKPFRVWEHGAVIPNSWVRYFKAKKFTNSILVEYLKRASSCCKKPKFN